MKLLQSIQQKSRQGFPYRLFISTVLVCAALITSGLVSEVIELSF
jgi:hypothetical protein